MGGGGIADYCFVHAADLHLGARRWLSVEPPDPVLKKRVSQADRIALRSLVELCLSERARFLLCAGDIIDGWCRDYKVALAFVEELLRLRDADCEVVLLLGNHDVRSRMLRSLPLPGFARLLGLYRPETVIDERHGVALHGWSAPDVAPGQDVAATYPEPLPGLLNIGLLHTSAEGRAGHPDYAPCSRWTLRTHGYDYWALGHVHTREVISTEPWIVFPGNLQGRGSREAGSRGASLVRVAAGRVSSVEHRPLDAVRFETLIVDSSSIQQFDDLLTVTMRALSGWEARRLGRPLVARVVLSGIAAAACVLEVPAAERARALEQLTREVCDETLWIDEIRIETASPLGSWALDRAA